MEKILVTGASGRLGTRVIGQLLKKTSPDQIVALIKNHLNAQVLISEGVEVRIGNYADKDSLHSAMKGITRALLISGPDLDDRFQQHKHVIDAAKNNGVQFIAYTSILIKEMNTTGSNTLTLSHYQTEEYLKASGMAYAIFRDTLYADDLPYYIDWREAYQHGEIVFSGGHGRVPWALREEMAEGFANLLLQPVYPNRIYNIGGSAAYSFSQIAGELSTLTQKNIRYVGDDLDRYVATLLKREFPEYIATFLIRTSDDIKNGRYDIATGDLEELLGYRPADLPTILRIIFDL